ncbi:RIN2_3 [Mytilus edulis]|uniref:RIN2_3 n=1 Tax=Mytilus edulis TaxID=6550 RepID=A0A8S3TGS0_MYTED|nr:RIN2_3 [Mytilus edulis]
MEHKTAIGLGSGQACRESTYQKMLNNIASDLDLLLNDLCHIYPYPVTAERKFTTFGKGQTYTDSSPGFGEDSAFGTLASTDSYNCEQKPRSDSVLSGHLDVFSLDHSPKALEIPSYPDNGSDPLSDSDHRPINFLERLSKTHPIWLLSEIGRSGATFIIRNSSQPNTYALSAQFPTRSGANVDHYLIENIRDGYRVQGSSHIFSDLTKLVAFYHENLEELPHRLVLPPTIRRAKTLQELTSLSLLGQDFWTSYRFDKGSNLSLSFQGSNNSLSTPMRCEPLHKSRSEPINITSAKHYKKQRLGQSLSTQCFKEPLSSQSEESLTGSHTNIHQNSSPVKFHLNRDGTVVSSPNIHHSALGRRKTSEGSICEKCQSNKQMDDNWSSGNSSDGVNSKTHPRVSKQKSNLYFTTSLDLLNIPDNQYFKSSLSDKMSDYEDVWRSSSCATPISSVQGKTKRHKCKRTNPYPKVAEKSTVTSPTLLNNAISVIRSENKIQTCIQNNLHTDAGVQTTHSGSISQRKLRKSVSLDIQNTQDKLGESFRSDKILSATISATISTQTSPVKVISKPKPLKNIVDKESCASSSSKSGIKSPVYAEPFDALDSNEDEHVNLVRIRRRSAPSMGLSGRKAKGVSQGPNLETIMSPGYESQENYDFEYNLSNGANPNDSEVLERIPAPMRRSHSMKERSSQNADNNMTVLDRESIKHVASELEKLHIAKGSNVNKQQSGYSQFKEDSMFDDCDDQEQVTTTLSRFPVYRPSKLNDASRHSMFSELSTVEDLISSVNPQLTVKPLQQIPTIIYSGAMSEYDNLTSHYAPVSTRSNAETEFCAPWDKTFYGSLLNCDPKSVPQMDLHSRILAWQKDTLHLDQRSPGDRSSCHSDSTLVGDSDEDVIDTHDLMLQPPSSGNPQGPDHKDGQQHNRKEKRKEDTPEYKIREYICRLSQDRNTTFGSTIENFIQCTLESQETNPHFVTRNVRQFMTGIKNYLVKHGEGELDDIIQKERTNLNPNEILNIDGIIEKALHVCVLQPLKHHIYRLFVEEYTRNGSLPSLSRNIKYARSKTPVEIGLRSGALVPNSSQMEKIRFHLTKMQKAYSPLKKLEHLLQATQCIYQCLNGNTDEAIQGPVAVGADDFLPMLIYVVVHCGIIAAEIEADYMWDLINPAVMNTEGGYYLTSLNSAVLVLKNFKEMQEAQNTQHESRLPSISDMQGFLKIAIPDELRDSIIWKTLPVRPNMNTRDVCSMIAHKFKITNPQDYGFYYIVRGVETKLNDSHCPQDVKTEIMLKNQDCVFAYKRLASNIAWPLSVKK